MFVLEMRMFSVLRACLCIFDRTFLGMEVSTGHTQIQELVKRVDETMEEFHLHTFYKVLFILAFFI